MGNTKTFEIVILNANAATVFFPGQSIEGHVLVELSDDSKVKGISISLTSNAQVVWQEGKITRHGKEDYLNLKLNLYGYDSNNSDGVTLSAGKHMFPFTFSLPVDLPGSFQGEEGCHVRHWMKAVMDRPWKFNKEYKRMFTVASVLDLNNFPETLSPLEKEMASRAGCCSCCNDGKVSASFRLEKTGFVPGESIKIYGEVVDGANIGINSTVVSLVRRATYSTDYGSNITRDLTKHNCNVRHGHVRAGGTDTWDGDKLRIPPVPSSYLTGCGIIDIQYFLKVVVTISRSFGATLRLTFPITIGTVPLYATIQQNPDSRQGHEATSEPDQAKAITDQPKSHISPPPSAAVDTSAVVVDLPPPSYAECVFGKVNTKGEGENYTAGNMNFAPSYIYYEDMV